MSEPSDRGGDVELAMDAAVVSGVGVLGGAVQELAERGFDRRRSP